MRNAANWISLCLIAWTLPAAAQEGNRYALLIGGLGGEAAYVEAFRGYLFETRQALEQRFGFDEVRVLAEPQLEGEAFVDGVATSEAIEAAFRRFGQKATAADQFYVFLFGHGSYDGERAYLNIPRRDLSDADYARLVASVQAGRVVFVNTASASAPFVEALSGPDRVVVTATRRGTQRNRTLFPQFLVEALSSPAADLDKNGDWSVQELFTYASEKTAQYFSDAGQLATEQALLEDTGDGQGFRVEELAEAGEGSLAGVTYLGRRATALADAGGVNNAALREMLREKEEIERTVADLKRRKGGLDEDAYYAQLETLFVRLARLNDAMER